jgi:hypothetical protein
VTPHEERLRDAYLAEMWPTVREVPYGEREEKRAADRRRQREQEERDAELAAWAAPVLPFREVS